MEFWLFVSLIIFQRILELAAARGNEKWMKNQGAIEFGKKHYPVIVLIHSLFFIAFTAEVYYFQKGLAKIWPLLLLLFFVAQAGRVWALFSLGRYWNTKIIVLPGAKVIKKGPYKFLKHPNYIIVSVEFIIIPLMFQAYMTAVLFSLLNFFILSVRIPAEEKALRQFTEYRDSFKENNRFDPKNINKL